MLLSDLSADILDQIFNDIEKLTSGFEYAILIICTILTIISIVFLSISKRYVDPYTQANKRTTNETLVSFFVAVRNDEKLLVDCINSMLNQTYKKREIFVIDDASTDNTPKIIEKNFGSHPEIKIIYLKTNVGKKRALAEGIKKSKGEVFAFTDSDSIWKEDAIEKIVTIFENSPNVGGVSGHCNASNADENILTKMQDAWYEKQYRFRKGFESVFGSVSCVSGPLACYRRAAIYNFIPKWEEDTFLGKEFRFATDRIMTGFALGGASLGPKIKENYSSSVFVKEENYPDRNWDIVYSQSAQAWTTVPNNFKDIISQKIRWNKSFIRNLFFTGKFYWKQPLVPAIYYYSHILYVLLSPIFLLILIGFFILKDYILLLAVGFMGSILISYVMNLTFARRKQFRFGAVINIIYQLFLPLILIYSIITIRDMNWERTSLEEKK